MNHDMERALILLAHGARDARWALPFEEVARRIRASSPAAVVELAYLEFIEPDLLRAGERIAQSGCTQVDVVPLFLGAGGHVRSDVPVLLDRLRADHPLVSWQLHPAIGEIDSVIQAMADAALGLLRGGAA
jgi:sirohydrochlorin cobaltochelatase